MTNTLIIYSSTDGHTLKICRRLQALIEQQAQRVELLSINDDPDQKLELFDRIVIGASIRYGRHRPQVYDFVRRNQELLERKPSAFFSVNIVARKPHKNRPETNPYIIKFLKKTTWKPKELGVFAGKLDYQKYAFWDRNIIKLIMWMTNGPTNPSTAVEFTNWASVDEFARRLSQM